MTTFLGCGAVLDCEPLKQEYSLHDLISQYQDSPNLLAYAKTFVGEAQKTIDNITDLSKALGADCVTGEALDLLGRILGQDRIWYDPEAAPWFAFDVTLNPLRVGFDNGKLWDGFTDLHGDLIQADDHIHRLFIKARMHKNNNNGTVDAMLDSLEAITCRTDIQIDGGNGEYRAAYTLEDTQNPPPLGRGLDIGRFLNGNAYDSNPMTFSLSTPGHKPISLMTQVFLLNYGLLPKPAGVTLTQIK